MAATNFVMKRYLTAGPLEKVMIQVMGVGQTAMLTQVMYRLHGSDDLKVVTLEKPIPASECPDKGDIVVEFPTHVVWMPPEHFTDQFCEV